MAEEADLQRQVKLLAERVQALDKFHEEIKPNMWIVTWAKTIASISAAGIFAAGFWLGGLANQVGGHKESIGKLETSIYFT